MATRYLIAYDVADPDRLRRVYQVVRSWGARVQDSVYEVLLTPTERVRLEGKLKGVMNLKEDQAMFIDLGDGGRTEVEEVRTLGLPYRPQSRGSVIV